MITEQRLEQIQKQIRDCSCSLDDDESKELFRLARLGIRYENATEPFLATLVTIQLKCEDEHQNVARALEIAIAAFRIALAQLPKQGDE